MKILLVHPKCEEESITHLQVPLGILYIASYIQNECEVKIYDEHVEDVSLTEAINLYNPDIIGISYTLQSSRRAYEICEKYKNEKFLIAGGVYPSLYIEEAIRNNFDCVIIGEGEHTIFEIIKAIKNKQAWDVIDGIAFLDTNKKIKINPKTKYIDGLDKIPLPARELLNMSKYELGSLITSRGCPYNCAFCSSNALWGKRYKQRSVKNVILEIKEIRYKYNQKIIHICDDTFTINHDFVINLCNEIIKEKIDIRWSILSRVDTIKNDENMIKLLKEAGCETVIFGIESGSQNILNRINKGYNINSIIKVVNLFKKYNFNIKTTWIVGLPGNVEEQLESLKLMKEIKPNQISLHLYIPYPGTAVYNDQEKYGLEINDKLFNEYKRHINPSYYNGKYDYDKVFNLNYIKFRDIIDITDKIKNEMVKQGYALPNEYEYGEEYTIKTFKDKIKNSIIKICDNESKS